MRKGYFGRNSIGKRSTQNNNSSSWGFTHKTTVIQKHQNITKTFRKWESTLYCSINWWNWQMNKRCRCKLSFIQIWVWQFTSRRIRKTKKFIVLKWKIIKNRAWLSKERKIWTWKMSKRAWKRNSCTKRCDFLVGTKD